MRALDVTPIHEGMLSRSAGVGSGAFISLSTCSAARRGSEKHYPES